jgi:hypothetical protein
MKLLAKGVASPVVQTLWWLPLVIIDLARPVPFFAMPIALVAAFGGVLALIDRSIRAAKGVRPEVM